jgi:hypothetical protein
MNCRLFVRAGSFNSRKLLMFDERTLPMQTSASHSQRAIVASMEKKKSENTAATGQKEEGEYLFCTTTMICNKFRLFLLDWKQSVDTVNKIKGTL